VPFHPVKTWGFAILSPVEFLAKMAYGSGMKNQAIASGVLAQRELRIVR
jgi:hypothetical protein